MSKKITIGTSPLTGTIFAGTILKDGMTWGANKQDVTMECLMATIEHALSFGDDIKISRPCGKVDFIIKVEDLRQ